MSFAAERAGRAIGRQTTRARNVPRRLRRELDDAIFSIVYVHPLIFRRPFFREEPRLRALLQDPYRNYVRTVSDQGMTISLQLACLLYFLSERLEPRVILDLGSGFSSYVFRHYARSRPGTTVYSVDDHDYWLSQTSLHLRQNGLSDRDLLTWRDLSCQPLTADLILHDLGSSDTRCRMMLELARFMNPATTVILDDVHKRPIREAAKALVRTQGLRVVDLTPLAYDDFGRFPWLISR
jgi:predicted O-methyltransferase YrrM